MTCPPLEHASVGKHASSGAFTLVEVAISLGIAGFALVALVGMLPVGLASQRMAISNTVESQIVQQVTNDILLTNFSNLGAKTYLFDYTGQALAAGATNPYYTASTVIEPPPPGGTPFPNPVDFQTTTASSGLLNQAYDVIISVANPTRPGVVDTYSVVVANTANSATAPVP